MSILAWAVLALIVAGCLYVLWLALQDPGRDPFLEVDDEWPGEVALGKKPWRSAEPVSLPGDEGYVDEDRIEGIDYGRMSEREVAALRAAMATDAEVVDGSKFYLDEDLELTERVEAEAVAERVIDNLHAIRQDGGGERG